MNEGEEMLQYIELSISEISRIMPLWKDLISYLKKHSTMHKSGYDQITFDKRMNPYLQKTKTGHHRIIVVSEDGLDIAYCFSSITKEKIGEIDSLYIDPNHRKKGIGEALVKDAFEFFDQHQTIEDIVMASEGNEVVLDFYKRFGFNMRYYTLKRSKQVK